METETKWRAIIGKNPTKRELVTWDEGQWICFLRFCELFIVKSDERTKDGSGVSLKVTDAKWREVEGFLDMPDHPFQEFLYRIDKFTYDPTATRMKFFWRLSSMVKFVLGYLRQNPSIVTTKMREIIEPNPRFSWCLSQTKIVGTSVGAVVTPDKEERVTNHTTNMEVASYEKNLADAVLKTTNLLVRLVDSIKPEEIEKMPVKDRLMAVGRMSYIFTVGKSFKVGKGIFKQININMAGREELEKAMLDFNSNE
jgi:hypothetical protein